MVGAQSEREGSEGGKVAGVLSCGALWRQLGAEAGAGHPF